MPAVADAATWVASTPLAGLMRTDPWLYPIVEIVHILGFVVLVGGVTLFDLRVLGFAVRFRSICWAGTCCRGPSPASAWWYPPAYV